MMLQNACSVYIPYRGVAGGGGSGRSYDGQGITSSQLFPVVVLTRKTCPSTGAHAQEVLDFFYDHRTPSDIIASHGCGYKEELKGIIFQSSTVRVRSVATRSWAKGLELNVLLLLFS